MPPSPLTGDAATAWTNQLINDFTINITTGSNGSGSERGLQSVLQLLQDNEATGSPSVFFRAGSLRAIIFVSDEDDQTMAIDNPLPSPFEPFTHYQCDQASLLTRNSAAAITGNNGYCCTNPANHCTFGAEGTTCPAKTVDGYTYTISTCPVLSRLIPVSDVKAKLDAFFLALDGEGAADPGYFISSIVALSGSTLQALHTQRNIDDAAAGQVVNTASDRADRYIALGNLVGNGSFAMDLGAADYSPLLDTIGDTIIRKKSTFTLDRAPTDAEEMIITLIHADGSSSRSSVPTSSPSAERPSSSPTQSLVLSFQATDRITINYQPNSVF